MNKKHRTLAIAVIFLWLVQLACNAVTPSAATPDPFATLDGLYTASALTVEAAASQPAYTATPGLPLPTATGTGQPGVQQPAPQSLCDAAQFLADVTIPDGTILSPGSAFVKTWRIKNIGTCTWTTSYALVFVSGDAMNAPASVGMPGTVLPGQYIDIPVNLTTPNRSGSYRGYWKLRNASGVLFGIGTKADTSVWVDVRVVGPSYSAYSFVDRACDADWINGGAALPCPGSEGSADGFVTKVNNPVLEDGSKPNSPAVLMVPQDKRDGFISGQFPAITILQGDRFRVVIGCGYNLPKCDVVFRLDYRLAGEVKTLGRWQEVYEGKFLTVDIDLSSLAGKQVKFILVVEANGGNNQDYALWLDPRIERVGTPVPTSTPTVTYTPSPTATFTSTPTNTPTETPTETPVP